MRDLERARDFLRQNSWSAGIPEPLREAFLQEGMLRQFERDVAVYRQGDPTNGLYGVVEGGIAFQIAPYEKGPNFAHYIRPGFWFGEMEILGDCPRHYTLVTTRPTSCLFLPLHAIDSLAAAHPTLWKCLGRLSVEHIALSIGAVDDLMIRDSTERIAAILLRLIDARIRDNTVEAVPEIDATQDDIAAMANMGRSAVVKCLGAFEAAGLIRRKYRRIEVLNQSELRCLLSQ
ncbi:Crp/Fnr family transcriptional regulator [Acuticoccus kandeliae]|uniref:Crp/Fnr family transcriptional regulator n=1 Tax=Acuticoccus kandeliae TaxID=2073160 RepID=UPI00130043A9|nr:Crp/Fnr family transcriptional regulator [Acuticoccus kandeliae]